jgi:pyrroline-5-carboxylate reductase
MTRFTFVGGGNMAAALIGGLVRCGQDPSAVGVVEPDPATRARLVERFGVVAVERASAAVSAADIVVWAVKPQVFHEAAAPLADLGAGALHLSVMAGVRCEAIVRATGSPRVVRAMPNTPALIGQGVAGLYARDEVGPEERAQVEAVLATTGSVVWLDREDALDAVTALSGSGPAYVFLFAEALVKAGVEMGLSQAQARELVLATFAGATALARAGDEPLATLRERVTSRGGTTFAALESMKADGVAAAIARAAQAAQRRAAELGRSLG